MAKLHLLIVAIGRGTFPLFPDVDNKTNTVPSWELAYPPL